MGCEESPDSMGAGMPGENPGLLIYDSRKCHRKENFPVRDKGETAG